MSKTKFMILDNGLTLILSEDPSKHYSYADLRVKIGQSTNNYVKENQKYDVEVGIPHFIEHYIIENSKFGNFMRLMELNYVETNGQTGLNCTDYYIDTVHDFNEYLEKLILIVNDANINDNDIEQIKKPILKEIDRKEDMIKHGNISNYNKAYSNTCKNVPKLNSLGTKEFITNLKSKDIKEIYDLFYQPKNEILIITGNFKEKEVLETIKKTFSKINRNYEKLNVMEFDESENVIKEVAIIEDSNKTENEIYVMYKIFNNTMLKIEKKKFFIYFDYLYENNFGEATNLFNNLFNNKKIKTAFHFDCRYDLTRNYFILTINSITDYQEEITQYIKNTIDKLKYDQESFQVWKNNNIIRLLDKYSKADYQAGRLLTNIENGIYESDSIELEKNLNLEEMIDILNKINFNNKSITIVKKNLY